MRYGSESILNKEVFILQESFLDSESTFKCNIQHRQTPWYIWLGEGFGEVRQRWMERKKGGKRTLQIWTEGIKVRERTSWHRQSAQTKTCPWRTAGSFRENVRFARVFQLRKWLTTKQFLEIIIWILSTLN